MLLLLSDCGWAPLYADPESGPASSELRAIHVDPIPDRIGQRLEMALRNSLNPAGEPTKERYRLQTRLAVALSNLGLQSQGTAVLGRLDVSVTYHLNDLKSGGTLLTRHGFAEFIRTQSEPVLDRGRGGRRRGAQRRRADQEIVRRLSLFMEQRVAAASAKPG